MNQSVEFGLCGIGMHFRSHMSRYFVGWQGRIPALLPWNSSFRFCSKGFVCPMVVWEISREVDYCMSVLYHQKLWSDMIKHGKLLRQFFEVNVGECRWTFGCLLQMYGTADGDVFWWCFVGRVSQNLLARKSMTWGRSWKPPKMPGLAMPCWVGLFCWNKAKICQDIDSCHQELGNSNIFKPCFFCFFGELLMQFRGFYGWWNP